MTEPVPLYTVRGAAAEIDWLGYIGDTVKIVIDNEPDPAYVRQMAGVLLAARQLGTMVCFTFEGGMYGTDMACQDTEVCTLTVRDREAEAADKVIGGIGRIVEQFGGAGSPFG